MIKQIGEKDLTECVNVIRESFLTVAVEFGFTMNNAPGFTAFSITKERLYWQYRKQHRPMYAYYDQNKIIGYYSLALVSDQECELNNLCVLPKFRGHDIGAELLNHAFATAKKLGCIKMNIGIVEENKRLRQWYERFGFVHTATKKFEFFSFVCGYMEKEL